MKARDTAKKTTSKKEVAVALRETKASKRVKVVDLAFKSKSAGAKPAEKAVQVSSTVGKASSAAKPGAQKKLAKEAATAPTVTIERSNVEIVTAPTLDTLKPFRRAAQENKKLLRAARGKGKGTFLAKPPRGFKRYTLDLRIQFPGTSGFIGAGALEMNSALLRLAKVKGLDMIAVTEDFSVRHLEALKEHASRCKVTVLPGFTMRCQVGVCNDVSLLALFPETFSTAELETVLERLGIAPGTFVPHGYCLAEPFASVIDTIESVGGILIPSRLDQTPFRQLAIPSLVEDYGFHTFDLVHCENPEFFRSRWPNGEFTFFAFSNASSLAQVGNRAGKVSMPGPGFAGLKGLVKRRIP